MSPILGKITNWDEDIDILKGFDFSSGNKAVKQLASYWRKEAKQLAGDDYKASAEAYQNIAASLEKTFINAKQFKTVKVAWHSIAEDGDTEYQIVVAQKQDGSWLVLAYSNWPF